jgi:hypothetical protein
MSIYILHMVERYDHLATPCALALVVVAYTGWPLRRRPGRVVVAGCSGHREV